MFGGGPWGLLPQARHGGLVVPEFRSLPKRLSVKPLTLCHGGPHWGLLGCKAPFLVEAGFPEALASWLAESVFGVPAQLRGSLALPRPGLRAVNASRLLT